jgi:hypothetical protein
MRVGGLKLFKRYVPSFYFALLLSPGSSPAHSGHAFKHSTGTQYLGIWWLMNRKGKLFGYPVDGIIKSSISISYVPLSSSSPLLSI